MSGPRPAPEPAPDRTAPTGSTALVEDLLARCVFPPAGTAVTCAVSGGADSMALLALAVAAGLRVIAVHVDHGLRPGSAAEGDIVAEAAARFGASFRAEAVDLADGPDLEQRARRARRAVVGPGALTGHTADDQAETVLINLLRGAGPAGLAGMRPGPPHPLLALRRAETARLCRDLGLEVVDDPTNRDPRFVRNRVRHELLPLLADISERDPVPLLCRTARHARQIVDDLDAIAAELDPTDTRTLARQPLSVMHAALRALLRDDEGHQPSTAELERAAAVVRHEAEACELSGGRRLRRSGGVLHLEPGAAPPRLGEGDSGPGEGPGRPEG